MTPGSRRGFFNALIRKLVHCLNAQGDFGLNPQAFTLPPTSEADFDLEDVLERLLDLIGQAMARWGDIRFVFLIDEIERLMDKPFVDDLLSNLRYIISNHPVRENIAFVMFGDRYLYEIAEIKGSPLENVMNTLQLGAFDDGESLQLIEMPAESQHARCQHLGFGTSLAVSERIAFRLSGQSVLPRTVAQACR